MTSLCPEPSLREQVRRLALNALLRAGKGSDPELVREIVERVLAKIECPDRQTCGRAVP